MRHGLLVAFALLAGAASPVWVHAQVAVIELPPAPPAASGATAQAKPEAAPALTTEDEKTLLRARELLAAEKPAQAESLLTTWLDNAVATGQGTSNLAAEALYLRGNAKLAQDREYDALVDYEQVVNGFPGSEFFARSLERELQVAKLYFGGRRRPTVLGLRIDSGVPLAEEIVLRIVERLPGSRLAERALLELGDFYSRTRDLRMASEVYDVHTRVFPRSPQRPLAMQRLVYSSIAQFKGPNYDTSVLSDAKVQVERFATEFPAVAQQTGMTDSLVARVDESQAQAMLERARWYITRDDAPAAKVFLQRLVQRHPQSAAAQEALTMLERSEPMQPQGSAKPEASQAAGQATGQKTGQVHGRGTP
jgi:outer membrane protein assembly factor BamD (BamD/ComL family)